jgi:hypothetical protein
MLGVNQLALSGPLDSFYLRIKVAVIVGAILSSPVWLYQIWAFVAPGLYAREKRWSYLFLGTAVPLFGIGRSPGAFRSGRSHSPGVIGAPVRRCGPAVAPAAGRPSPVGMAGGVEHRDQPYGQGDDRHDRDDNDSEGGSVHVGTSL